MLVSLASLTAEPDAASLDAVVSGVNVDRDTVEVCWAQDAATTRIGFGPVTVTHG